MWWAVCSKGGMALKRTHYYYYYYYMDCIRVKATRVTWSVLNFWRHSCPNWAWMSSEVKHRPCDSCCFHPDTIYVVKWALKKIVCLRLVVWGKVSFDMKKMTFLKIWKKNQSILHRYVHDHLYGWFQVQLCKDSSGWKRYKTESNSDRLEARDDVT